MVNLLFGSHFLFPGDMAVNDIVALVLDGCQTVATKVTPTTVDGLTLIVYGADSETIYLATEILVVSVNLSLKLFLDLTTPGLGKDFPAVLFFGPVDTDSDHAEKSAIPSARKRAR